MDAADLLERLRAIRLLQDVPPTELQWLVTHGRTQQLAQGEFYFHAGDKPESLWLVLSGHVAIFVDRGLGPRRVLEWKTGDISGVMPYSRMTRVPGNVIALAPTNLLTVHRDTFVALTRECPTFTERLVHAMLDRARTFTSSDMQDEKMVSLGRIAAGLAHELNNPASAATRSARLLTSHLEQAEQATRDLAAAQLSDEQLVALDRARTVCASSASPLSPIERADREDALDTWLSAHDVDPGLAAALVDTGATPQALDALGRALSGPTFETSLRWITACCSVKLLAREIETASSRIYDLVSAIKRFTFMDRHQAPDAVDLAQGLRDSVVMLQHKARGKGATVTVHLPDDLPKVRAIGSDLNQVWTNIVDNALDAIPSGGHVDITAQTTGRGVIVRIVDDGPGIPPEIRDRIFDAFFTTKGVGQGTGLGLEITRRLVHRNEGDIEVDSVPGRTAFSVLLQPWAPAAGGGA